MLLSFFLKKYKSSFFDESLIKYVILEQIETIIKQDVSETLKVSETCINYIY